MSTDSSNVDVISQHKPSWRVPWHPWLGIIASITIFIASQFIASVMVWFYPSLAGWSQAHARDWISNSLTAQISYMVIASGLTLGGIYAFVSSYGRQGLHSIGLKKPKWVDVGWGVAALPLYLLAYIAIVSIVLQLVPHLNLDQKQELGFNGTYAGLQLIPIFITLVILPPLTEEIVFRGVLYGSFKKLVSLWPAAVMTSLIFAAGHLQEGGASGPLYIGAIDTFTLSMILIYLREKTGRLWAGMTLHACKNFIAFTTLFLLHAR